MSTVTQQPGSYRHLDEQYLQKYGVKCAECGQLFVGKVLQAREKKYHPSCAKCSRCGGPFIEGDEMCIKGGKIWHLSCDGKRRGDRSLQEASADNRENNVDNSFIYSCTGSFRSPNSAICPIYSPRSCDSLPNQAITPTRSQSNPPPPRPISSGSFITDHNTFGRSFTSSFIGSSRGEIKLTGLRGVVSPSPSRSPQFHRPKNFSYRNTPSFNLPNRRPSSGIARAIGGGASSSASSRPSSGRVSPAPPMNNQEPIKLATQPGGYRRSEDDPVPVERDDFPAPPAKNLVEIRIRRKSGDPQQNGRSSSDLEDDDNARKEAEIQRLLAESAMDAEKLDKVIEELEKMSNKGIGNALLKELQKKRAQMKKDPLEKLDPRSASRTPNAAREPWRPTRFESAVEASPSRLDPVYIPPEVLDNSQLFQRVPQVGPRSSTTGGLGGNQAGVHVGNPTVGLRSASVGEQRNIVINMPIPKPGYTLSSTKTSSNAGGSVVSSSNGINDVDDEDDDVLMGDDDVLVSPLSTTHASPAKMPATIMIQ